MQISRLSRLPLALAAACAVAACASTDYHFSQLSGSRYHQVPIDTYPVSIVRVDGQDVMLGSLKRVVVNGTDANHYRPYSLVDAGPRQITVQGPPGGTGGVGETRTIPLDVAPCTRYYLVAVKSNPLANDFTVRVDHQEPVSGCTPA